MKKFFIFILIVILIIGGGYAALYNFINRKGKNLILKSITDKYGVEASLEEVTFRFPFNLELTNFSCKDISFFKGRLNLTGVNPFNRTFILGNVYLENLDLKVEKKKNEIIIKPFLTEVTNVSRFENKGKVTAQNTFNTAGKEKEGFKDKISFEIKEIILKDSSLNIIENSVNPPINVFLKDFDLKIKDFKYPELSKFHIDFRSSLEGKNFRMKDLLSLKGWVDLKDKNMDVKVKITNFDYTDFEEYYPRSWRSDNLEIEEAFFSLEAVLKSVNNDLSINFTLVLEDITFVDNPEDPSRIRRLKTILAFFKKDENGKPMFKPSPIKTKMDKLELDFSALWEEIEKNVKIGFFTVIGALFGKAPDIIEKSGDEIKKITVEPAVETIKSVIDIFKGLLIMDEEDEEGGEKKEDSEKLYVPDTFKIKF